MGLYEEGFTQNRELSWLKYDERVLEEALDTNVPLFERLNYLSIFVSNLEEFIQVRVGGLIGEEDDDEIDSKSGMTAHEQLLAIYSEIPELLDKKDRIQIDIETELAKAGLIRMTPKLLSKDDRQIARAFFHATVAPQLRTYLLSDSDDMPFLDQNKIYIAARLNSEVGDRYAIVDISSKLPKILVLDDAVPAGDVFNFGSSKEKIRPFRYILTEDVIKLYLSELFSPFVPLEICTIDIARNAEVELEDPGKDMLANMKKISKLRKIAAPDKLIVDSKLSENLSSFLKKTLKLRDMQVFRTKMIDYSFVGEVEDAIPEWLSEKVCFSSFEQRNQLKNINGSVIDHVLYEDILSAYPYDSMDPFLELLREAAYDPRVKKIRMTIYRLASQAVIAEYLMLAAKNGKEVGVLMELRARFDEEKNIDWAEKLSQSGCKVYFGDEKYKVHSKVCQIVLETEGDKRYISHLSTGNFNEKTAKKYTDLALITSHDGIGKAVNDLWKDLRKSKTGKYDHILTSPVTMKKTLISLIHREADKGRDGRIFIKVNSVTDDELMEELMKASCKGCMIRMVVRGICCLLPHVPFCTENIDVVNVVGRLLEHSRVYMFGSGKDEILYISSADLMTRNMEKRVELACPIYDRDIRKRIIDIMALNYADNVKGRVLDRNGDYHKKADNGRLIDSQQMLMQNK